MKVNSYKDLEVWRKSMQLVEEIYLIAHKLPKSEIFGLISQIQRAAISIPSNVAEGSRRGSKLEYIHFLNIARGSAAELETQLLIISKIYSIEVSSTLSLLDEISKMLYSLIFRLKNK